MGLDEKGFLAKDQETRRTSEEERKIGWENTARRTDNRNKNAELDDNTRRLQAQFLANFRFKNWNALAAWNAEQQGRYEQNLANQYDFIKNAMAYSAQQRIDDATWAAKERLRQAIRANQNNPTWDMYDSDEYKDYARIARETSQQI